MDYWSSFVVQYTGVDQIEIFFSWSKDNLRLERRKARPKLSVLRALLIIFPKTNECVNEISGVNQYFFSSNSTSKNRPHKISPLYFIVFHLYILQYFTCIVYSIVPDTGSITTAGKSVVAIILKCNLTVIILVFQTHRKNSFIGISYPGLFKLFFLICQRYIIKTMVILGTINFNKFQFLILSILIY